MTVATRLGHIRKFLGLSQKDMARRFGVSGTTWQNYELENAAPNAHVLGRLSGEGFNINWVLTGMGEMRAGERKMMEKPTGFAELEPLELEGIAASRKHVLIPRYALRTLPREGGEAAMTMEEVSLLDTIAFRRDFIESDLKADPASLIAIEAADNSMSPTFGPGDILLADTSEPRLRGSGIYVFASGGALLVKRLQVKLDGGFIVSSDNAELYPAEEIERTALERVKIVGRVIWRGGRL
ncbi:putative phage repressor [Parvibaculum lavamentivorans DS-1]|uniref:Putative phage repressor n=1 Tax=Parvibaculum lavamentivorans (strain DS-1 / DSM 13023 / NCIMB 13966) TaxID=402881 RepID=A7HTS5_PARL1|nr:putative phage repressor [Parvibaculum lavamentivorans DS-1]